MLIRTSLNMLISQLTSTSHHNGAVATRTLVRGGSLHQVASSSAAPIAVCAACEMWCQRAACVNSVWSCFVTEPATRGSATQKKPKPASRRYRYRSQALQQQQQHQAQGRVSQNKQRNARDDDPEDAIEAMKAMMLVMHVPSPLPRSAQSVNALKKHQVNPPLSCGYDCDSNIHHLQVQQQQQLHLQKLWFRWIVHAVLPPSRA